MKRRQVTHVEARFDFDFGLAEFSDWRMTIRMRSEDPSSLVPGALLDLTWRHQYDRSKIIKEECVARQVVPRLEKLSFPEGYSWDEGHRPCVHKTGEKGCVVYVSGEIHQPKRRENFLDFAVILIGNLAQCFSVAPCFVRIVQVTQETLVQVPYVVGGFRWVTLAEHLTREHFRRPSPTTESI